MIVQGTAGGVQLGMDAPYVAVIRVLDAGPQGPRLPLDQHGPKTVQLVRCVANVENAIRGELKPGPITIYFFANLGPSPDYMFTPGERYITALRRDGDTWRSWTDGQQMLIHVFSGSHEQETLPLDRGPWTAVAYILLTPTADYAKDDFFTRNLSGNEIYFSQAGPLYVRERFREMEKSKDPAIRDWGCLADSSIGRYHPPCLDSLVNSQDAEIRAAAEQRLRDADNDRRAFLSLPLLRVARPELQNYIEQLAILAEDARPDVRAAAMQEWRRLRAYQLANPFN